MIIIVEIAIAPITERKREVVQYVSKKKQENMRLK